MGQHGRDKVREVLQCGNTRFPVLKRKGGGASRELMIVVTWEDGRLGSCLCAEACAIHMVALSVFDQHRASVTHAAGGQAISCLTRRRTPSVTASDMNTLPASWRASDSRYASSNRPAGMQARQYVLRICTWLSGVNT